MENFMKQFAIICLLCFVVGALSDSQESFFNRKDQEVCEGDNCGHASDGNEYINVVITFTNAVSNTNLQNKFRITVSSLLKHATVPISLYIVGEDDSQKLASKIVDEVKDSAIVKMEHLDVDVLASQMKEIIEPLQKHFSYKPGAYYSHALFFLSVAIHNVFPKSVSKIIMMDADLKIMSDIKNLYDQFELFTADNVLGIAHEMQPVYRHQFWEYRNNNPGTRVGDPPPNGLPGFNSGVLLLNLDKMRQSELYNSLINSASIEKLTSEFKFKGHLGDQDFFTLVGMKYEQLFYVIPCSWNRQLCTWWRDMGGYKGDAFNVYHNCASRINIYHGNCNTPIPF